MEKIELYPPSQYFVLAFREQVDYQSKGDKELFESLIRVRYECINEAIGMLEANQPEALDYSLSVLRGLGRGTDNILNLTKGRTIIGLEDQLLEGEFKFKVLLLSKLKRTTTISIREEVLEFAHEMDAELFRNEHKGSWKEQDFEYLFNELRKEVEELKGAIGSWQKREGASLPNLVSECADVANFAMMIADVARKRTEERVVKSLGDAPIVRD